MSRTVKNSNVINNKKSNKSFKKLANSKLRKQTKLLIKASKFDVLNESLVSVSNFWDSNKEWKKFEI